MKRVTSKRIGRDYFTHETRFESHEGLPCFNLTEVGLLKTLPIDDALLNQIFDAKVELNCHLIELIPKKEPPPIPYSENKRKEVAGRWAGIIAETIKNTKVKT